MSISKKTLRAHQQAALDKLAANPHFALFWEMGCGKTLPTALDLHRRGLRSLVIAPLAVLPSWVEELQCAGFKRSQIGVVRGSRGHRRTVLANPEVRVFVINYDLLTQHADDLMAAGVEAIVADESHRLINVRNRWSRAALKLAASASVTRCLTGTPIRHTPLDLYGQMRFLSPDILPWRSYFAFKARFGIEVARGNFRQLVGVRDEHIIHQHVAPYVDYMRFDDVVDMPDWVEEQRVVPLTTEQQRAYKELKRELLTVIDGHDVTAQNAAVQMLKLAQVAGGTIKLPDGSARVIGSKKLDELRDVADQIDGQLVVWARFRAEIEWVAEQMGWPFIHGGTSAAQRAELLADFAAGRLKGIVCQIQAVGEGVNELAGADAEVRWSYDFSYTTFVQSRARIRRMNRANPKPCRSIMLVADGTVDTHIVRAVEQKQSVALDTLDAIRALLDS